MVFKFGTVAVMLSTLLAFSEVSVAQDRESDYLRGGSDCGILQDAYVRAKDAGRLEDAKEYKDDYEACQRKESSSNSDVADCPSANTAFLKTKGEFEGACGNANIPQQVIEGHMGCSRAMTMCSCYPPTTIYNEAMGYACGRVQGSINENLRSAPKGVSVPVDGVDVNALHRALAYCPTVEQSDIETLEKQIAEAKKSIPAMKKEISQLKGQAEDAEISARKEVESIEQQLDEAASAYAKGKMDLENEAEESAREILAEKNSRENEIVNLENRIVEIELQKSEADAAATAKIQETEMICYADGVQKVDKEQIRVASQGGRKRGNNQDMMKQVGLTDRQYWQRKALKYYEECKLSDIYTKPVAAARAQAEAQKLALTEAQGFVRKEIDRKRNEVTQLVGATCGAETNGQDEQGLPVGPKACEAIRKQEAAAKNLKIDYDKANNRLKKNARNAKSDGAKKAKRLRDQAGEQQALINEEEARLRNLRDQLGALKLASNGGVMTTDKAEFRNARAKFGELRAAADAVQNACSTTAGICQPGTNCQVARDFLKAIGATPTNIHKGTIPPATEESYTGRTPDDPASDVSGDTSGTLERTTPAPTDGD